MELAGIVAAIGLHIGEMIGGIMTQYAQPRPWLLLSEGGDNTYVSSAMPQKRNPGLLNNTRAEASDAVAAAEGVFLRAHNVVSGMMDGKSAGKNTGMADTASSALTKLRRVIAGIVVNRDRALEELNLDWTASQNIADVMMQEFGIPFREGHHYSSELVTFARAHEYTPITLPYEDAKSLYETMVKKEGLSHIPSNFPFTESAFRSLLDPKSIVEARRSEGGPQKPELDRLFKAAEQSLETDTAWLESKVKLLRDAEIKLNSAFKALED